MELDFEKNQLVLANRLNKGVAFDVPLVFKAKDQLEIVLNNNNQNSDWLMALLI